MTLAAATIPVTHLRILGKAPMVNRAPAGHLGERRAYQANVLNPWYKTVAYQAQAQCREKPPGPFYLLVVEFRFAWTKLNSRTGKVSRDTHARDSDGPVKPTQDALALWLGVDDTATQMLTIPFVLNYTQGARDNEVVIQIASLPRAPRPPDVAALAAFLHTA